VVGVEELLLSLTIINHLLTTAGREVLVNATQMDQLETLTAGLRTKQAALTAQIEALTL